MLNRNHLLVYLLAGTLCLPATLAADSVAEKKMNLAKVSIEFMSSHHGTASLFIGPLDNYLGAFVEGQQGRCQAAPKN